MTGRFVGLSGLLGLLMTVCLINVSTADEDDDDRHERQHRLPCNGVVSLYHGDKLVWRKGPKEIRQMEGLVAIPDEPQAGITGLKLSSLLEPGIAAIELETCKPRLRRFERTELTSEHGAGLYLVATNYRGFRLRNTGRKRGGGGGMKNIGRIVLIPASDHASGMSSGKHQGRGTGGGAGKGTGKGAGHEIENESDKAPDRD